MLRFDNKQVRQSSTVCGELFTPENFSEDYFLRVTNSTFALLLFFILKSYLSCNKLGTAAGRPASRHGGNVDLIYRNFRGATLIL